MKLDRKHILLFAIIVVALMCMKGMGPVKTSKKVTATGKWTVYGTNWCGYTKKQLKYMDDNSIDYEYVECVDGACDAMDIKAFPVLKTPNGEMMSPGYREI